MPRVYWEPHPSDDESWTETLMDPDVWVLGLRRYRLRDSPGWGSRYLLEFEITGQWAWRFFDAGGGFNDCFTLLNGIHSVRYNSDRPAIVDVIAGAIYSNTPPW